MFSNTKEDEARRVAWICGADVTKPLMVQGKMTKGGYLVYLGQAESLDLRINRIGVTPAQLAALLASVIQGMTGQAVGVVNEKRGGPSDGQEA